MAYPLFSLDEKELSSITDSRTFRRGREYARLGCVGTIRSHDGSIEATVQGTNPYHTKLWRDQGGLRSACTCPIGEEGFFCKHGAALGLAWLGEGPVKETEGVHPSIDMERIRSSLLTREKSELADIIVELALEDDRLLRRLTMEAARGEESEEAVLRGTLDDALCGGVFIDHREAAPFARGIEDAVEGIVRFMESGNAAAAVGLVEHALKALESRMNDVDDSDGNMRPILERLQEIHHEACLKARPDGKELARRILTWELESDWDVFHDAINRYGDVLGEPGMETYRSLAEAEWARCKPLSPSEDDKEKYGNRHRIARIMEALARRTGDVERVVEVLARDLSTASSFLEISQEYGKAGMDDRALEWAEKGIRAFPDHTDSRLREFLSCKYHSLDRHEEAMELVWNGFTERPDLQEFQALKTHAERFDAWPQWREKAHGHLRTLLAEEKAATPKRPAPWRKKPDGSTIVRVLIWEKKLEAAWKEAREDGCSEDLWFELARLREKDHPEDAIPIYQRRVEMELASKDTARYQEAVRTLKDIQRQMKAAGVQEQFPVYRLTVRDAHRQKRNFVKLLDQVPWE